MIKKSATSANQATNSIGVGLGLRSPHYSYILENRPRISWFEAISENYMGLSSGGTAGRPLQTLDRIRKDYPVVLHGVSMSIGSVDELDPDYLRRLQKLIQHTEPLWVSDHLCWTGVHGENLHDLLPLPFTEEALKHLERKIQQAQSFLKRPLVFENVSTYISFNHSEMTEWEFLAELSRRTGCSLLLDVNNVYVSAINQGFNPLDYLRGLKKDSIEQMHLAGHSSSGSCLIDTHDGPVADPVWQLYEEALKIFGAIPTLIEWDDKIPDFETLSLEARKAEKLLENIPAEAPSEKSRSLFV
jgi:uncharacterized protein (UPF0276 family)